MTAPNFDHIEAMNTARELFFALGDGGLHEWHEVIEFRKCGENFEKESNRKFAALVKRGMRYPMLHSVERGRLESALIYFESHATGTSTVQG